MDRNFSISLDDHCATFVDLQVQVGRYDSASEVVQTGLLLLEAHDACTSALQQALIAGEESGPPQPFDTAAFLQRMRTEHVR